MAEKERARRLREELDPTRPDRPKGWSRRVSDRAVLQWGAKRDFIRKMHNAAPRHQVVGRILIAVREILTRAQKKRKRRRTRRDAALLKLKPLVVLGGVAEHPSAGGEEVVVLSP